MGSWQIAVHSELIVKFSERKNAGSITYNLQIHYLPVSISSPLRSTDRQNPSCPKPLFQSEAKCEAINKTYFHKKGFHLASFSKLG